MIIGAIAWERGEPGHLTIVAITTPDSSGAHPKSRLKHLSGLFRSAVTANDHELAHEMAGALIAAQRAPYAIMSFTGLIEVSDAASFGEFVNGLQCTK